MNESDPYKAPAEDVAAIPDKRHDENLGVIAFAFSMLIFTFLLPDLVENQFLSSRTLFAVITLPFCSYVSILAVRAGGSWNLAFGLLAVGVQLGMMLRVTQFIAQLIW